MIHFSGMTLIADPEAMLASPMYLEDLRIVNKEQEQSSSGGVSKTGVAFIAVVCTLAVVAVALVAYVVSKHTITPPPPTKIGGGGFQKPPFLKARFLNWPPSLAINASSLWWSEIICWLEC